MKNNVIDSAVFPFEAVIDSMFNVVECYYIYVVFFFAFVYLISPMGSDDEAYLNTLAHKMLINYEGRYRR